MQRRPHLVDADSPDQDRLAAGSPTAHQFDRPSRGALEQVCGSAVRSSARRWCGDPDAQRIVVETGDGRPVGTRDHPEVNFDTVFACSQPRHAPSLADAWPAADAGYDRDRDDGDARPGIPRRATRRWCEPGIGSGREIAPELREETGRPEVEPAVIPTRRGQRSGRHGVPASRVVPRACSSRWTEERPRGDER